MRFPVIAFTALVLSMMRMNFTKTPIRLERLAEMNGASMAGIVSGMHRKLIHVLIYQIISQ